MSSATVNLPPIEITNCKIAGRQFHIVRDDLLPGGTKQRGAVDLLQMYKENGVRHIVYASPFCGYAQIALAYVAAELGMKCTIVCEQDRRPGIPPNSPHPYTQRVQSYGGEIFITSSLESAEERSQEFLLSNPSCVKIPLGFDCPEFYRFYTAALSQEWVRLISILGSEPRVLWLPVGSGTLVRSFAQIVSAKTKIKVVNVRVLQDEDDKIRSLHDLPRVQVFKSPFYFHESATDLPPFPSNAFYDAKIWAFASEHGQDNDVWWNVAGD